MKGENRLKNHADALIFSTSKLCLDSNYESEQWIALYTDERIAVL